MSMLMESDFGFAKDRLGLSFQKWADGPASTSGDVTLNVSRWNIHNGAADTMSATYSVDAQGGRPTIKSVEFGGLPLTVTGLDLALTATEYQLGNWVHRLNEGDDTFYGTNYDDVIQ